MINSNKNNSIKKLVILSLVIISLLLVTLFFNNKLKADNILESEVSLIKKQEEIDKDINTSGYSIDEPKIILDPYDISPLTAIILFETDEKVAPVVTIKSNNNSKDIVHKFDLNTKHYLPIYGLYADYDNQVIITLNNKDYNFKIKTNTLPDDFQKVKDIYVDKSKINYLNKEFYFVTPASKGYTSAYDIDGEVRWYLNKKMVWEMDTLNNQNLLLSSERLINPPYYTTGLYELSPLGKIYNEFVLPGGYHHDYFELDNGNLIVASNNFDEGTVEDVIVEIDRKSGDIVKSIDLKDILITDKGKSEDWTAYDWFHNNSTFYDKETNSLTLSGRHQDIVVNIDYDSLKINYIVGDSDTFSKESQKHFLTPTNDLEWQYSQHAAKILPNGNMFIFDNGNNRSKNKKDYIKAKDNYSRGVIYDINQENMEITQVFQYGKERGSDYYSPYISDVDYIDENHYLIHSGGVAYKDNEVLNKPPGLEAADKLRSFTTEVLNNKKIFELVLDNNNYRAKKMNIYNDNERFVKDSANYLGNLKKTKVDKQSYGLLFNTKTDKEIFDRYNIDLTKENDRLVVSGEFSFEDEVKIILYNNFSIKKYNVRVSKTPYTAMCLDIFNEEEKITIDKYINDEGLNSTYSLFIEINNNIYNINKSVNFD